MTAILRAVLRRQCRHLWLDVRKRHCERFCGIAEKADEDHNIVFFDNERSHERLRRNVNMPDLRPEKSRPNILLLFTDQQRFDTIRAAGYEHMKTPNIDRLVRDGCLFTHAYTPNPICVPARYSMLTGTTESQHNIVDNSTSDARIAGLATTPQVLSDNGYFTAAVGKMHHSPPRRHHGFLEMYLMEEIPRHRCDDGYAQWLAREELEDVRTLHGSRPLIYHEPQKAMVDADHHGSAWVAAQTIDVIRRNAGRRPFFIQCGWIKPHPPWNIPDSWWGHYEDSELPLPIGGGRISPLFTNHSAWFGDDDSAETIRQMREAYYTSISMIDHAVGKILDHLHALDILDNTLVIFASDHGEMLADHSLYQKMQPYESSAHIPFIARWPSRFEPGSRDDRFVDLLDIMPTILDAAGIDTQTIRSAREFRPAGASLLRQDGRDRSTQRCAYGNLSNRWVMLRDTRYKYVHFSRGGIEWLFDLESDPEERENLVGSTGCPMSVLKQLRSMCVVEERRMGPEGGVVNNQLYERETEGTAAPSLTGKFPGWANTQMPYLGDLPPDDEAALLAKQIRTALAWAGPEYLSSVSSERRWYEHFIEGLQDRGVSETKIREIREYLGLLQV